MRRRIEEGRKSLRRTALIIVAVTALFAGGLAVFSRDYVAPYSTPFGQVMLAIVLAVFAAGLMWIRLGRQPQAARAVPGRRRPGRPGAAAPDRRPVRRGGGR